MQRGWHYQNNFRFLHFFNNVSFFDIEIESIGKDDFSRFELSLLEDVRFERGKLSNLDWSSIFIHKGLQFDEVAFKNVTFSEKQRECISFNEPKPAGITWSADALGQCLDSDKTSELMTSLGHSKLTPP